MLERMIQAALVLVIGFLVLAWSADRFVLGAGATARRLGISPLTIGLTVVGFGTSAPEMLVSAVAAWEGNPGLAIGNAIGSNIANLGLIIGATAVVAPLTVHSRILRREVPLLLAVMALTVLLMLNLHLGRLEGAIMLSTLVAVLGWMVALGRRDGRKSDSLGAALAAEIPAHMPLGRALTLLGAGLAGLLLSSRALVWGAVIFARGLGVSDEVIGLTVIALGTSLPELAASIASSRKGADDIAIGNIIGSNIFNLLAVMGLAATIRPMTFGQGVLIRDYALMTGLTLLFVVFSYGFRMAGHGKIGRIKGIMLLAVYFGYQFAIYLHAIRQL